MAKKVLALVMTLMLALSMVPQAAFFTDLHDGSYDWAKDVISDLADRGIIKGYSDGTYGPGKQITRQEAFTLFARAAGVNDSFNAYGVEFNQYVYKDIADKYNTYAKKELCFMLERGIISEADIDTYLSEENKDKIMLRHEAAVLISKILDVRDGFDENGEYEYNFTDIDKIPAESLAAVAFAQSAGILTGMEDGSFSPDTGVTRAQIAIMLDRVINKLNIKYITGTVTSVYEGETAAEIDGVKYTFDKNTIFRVNGETRTCEDIAEGDSVTMVNVDSGVWAVEIMRLGELVFETVKGTVEDISSSSVTLTDGSVYNVSAFLACYEKGESIKYDEMNYENPVTLELVNGFVRTINGTGSMRMYENAKITSITLLPEEKLRFTDEDGVNCEYKIDKDADITRNGYETELEKLATKELVYVCVDEGVITHIGSYANFGEDAVKIRQIVIDEKESSILLDLDDGERVKVEENTLFTDEDENIIEIYDLRIGDTVVPEFKEGRLAVLKYGKYVPPTSFGGEIKSIDVKNGTIVVEVKGEERTVKITAATSMIKYSAAQKITIEDLDVSDYVVVAGDYSGDEFIATSIIL